jgi:hypothetical protein
MLFAARFAGRRGRCPCPHLKIVGELSRWEDGEDRLAKCGIVRRAPCHSATYRVDPFAAPLGYDRYVRIPAEDRSRREGSRRLATVDVAVGGNGHFERFTARVGVRVLPITLTPPIATSSESHPLSRDLLSFWFASSSSVSTGGKVISRKNTTSNFRELKPRLSRTAGY